MAEYSMVNQPLLGNLGDLIEHELASGRYHALNMLVAFAKKSGVSLLGEAMASFRLAGGTIRSFVGIDLDGTSYEALEMLLALSDELFVVHVEADQTFHPKIYNLVGPDAAFLAIGSNNLTRGGLWTNFESTGVAALDLRSDADASIQDQMDGYFDRLLHLENVCLRIESSNDLERLRDEGYLRDEVKLVIEASRKRRQRANTKTSKPLFAASVPASFPALPKSARDQKVGTEAHPKDAQSKKPVKDRQESVMESDTIWFETGALTGGSRNILDLSKTAKIVRGDAESIGISMKKSGMMAGGVQFFGIDPNDVHVKKNVAINYEGIDYVGNTILIETGEKANKSWRLQLKGVSSEGIALTKSVRPGFFAHKVMAFSKVSDDYYYMALFPETDLEEFKAVSAVCARNGVSPTARLFGYL